MRSSLSRRSFLAGAGAAAAGLAGCTAPADRGALDSTATAQFRVTPDRHGFRDVAAPDAVERAWRLPDVNVGEHTAAKASPLPTPSGDLVVPGDSGLLYRVSPGGDVRWRAATDPSVRGIHGTPAIANGSVYVGAYDGTLYAFDLATGVREWRTKLGDAIGSSPLYLDGRLFVAVEYYAPSGSLFSVDAATGEVVWEDDRPTDHPHSSPAIDDETGTLVVGSNDGYLYAWDYPGLEFAWRFETGDAIKGPIATHDGAAFVGSWDHHVYRVDLESGAADWAFEAGDKVMSGPGVDDDGGTVYVGSHDESLYALDV
ncbi:MAG TPA: PQQ-binding-like beta-propeller repeat protein, partial [Halobacteriales archaeon]|nr:PQQ-binding-like beta-propeller repeat protein [Halobacteriales archaeon]